MIGFEKDLPNVASDGAAARVINPANGIFVLYLTVFIATWTVYVLLVYRHVQALGEDTLAYAAVNISIRLTVWVLPVCLYLRFVDRVEPTTGLNLRGNWKRGVLFGVGVSIFILAGSMIRFGQPIVAWNYVTWNSVISTSFGIGFFEEIPFRGFILQKLTTRINFLLANILTSIIFVGMHLPGWIMLHLFTPALALNILIFSLTMGAVFRYSRSLWGSIIAHDANDFISFVLFHGR